MNVFRDDVEHAERPKMRRWASVATPNSQHLAAPATRRGRLYTREHPKRANQKIMKLCKARNAGGSDYPQYQKIEKCLPKRKRAKKTVVPRRGSGRREVAVPRSGCRRGSTRCDWRTSRRGTSRVSAAARRAKNLFQENPPRK